MTGFETLERVSPIKIAARAGPVERCVPHEEAVAVVCNGTSVAVMMATPAELRDFATGFVLSEGIVRSVDEIESCEIVPHAAGLEARLWIAEERARALLARRRAMVGPTGCGLCGIESLEQVHRALPQVDHAMRMTSDQVRSAMAELRTFQVLNAATRAVHAAALWRPDEGIVLVREDVGRHNALDKLVGALAREGGGTGALLLTSRVSIELVQKAALAGLPIVAAVSVPTLAAIRLASGAGITLIGIARDDGYEVFTRPDRIEWGQDVSG